MTMLAESRTVCLCSVLGFIFSFGKFFGFSPFSYRHEGITCRFEKSPKYFVLICMADILLLVCILYFFNFDILFERNEITVLLSYITDLTYDFYYVELIVFNLYSQSNWIKTLTNLNKLMQKGVICRSVLELQSKLQKLFVWVFVFVLVFYCLLLLYLIQYEHEFPLNYFTILGKLLQNFVFIFYIYFFSFLILITSSLNCFYKISFASLKYKSIYPMKKILGTPNEQDFLILITYQACGEEHTVPVEFEKKTYAEIIEYFRLLHGEISRTIEEFNRCFNPQLLLHTTVEILMLVINWYSVIIGFAYRFHDPEYRPIMMLNLAFSVLHTVGLFSFLRNSQKLSDTIEGYIAFLLEYSTRVSSPIELLQLRIFIEKLKQHTPFSANGMFTIDMGIAGPIFANILTYVLVALQFDISP